MEILRTGQKKMKIEKGGVLLTRSCGHTHLCLGIHNNFHNIFVGGQNHKSKLKC